MLLALAIVYVLLAACVAFHALTPEGHRTLGQLAFNALLIALFVTTALLLA